MDFSKIIVPKVKIKFDISKITIPTITLPTLPKAKVTGTVGLGTFFKNELNIKLNEKAKDLNISVPKVDTQTIWDKIKSVFKPPILNQRFMDALKRQTQMEGNQTPSDFDVFKTGLVNIAGIEAILLATGQIIANIANTIKTTNYLTQDLKNSTNILKQYSEETINPNNLTDIYREGVRAVRPDLFVSSSLKPDMEAMAKLNVAYRYLESYASDMKVTGSFVSELFKTKLYLLTGIQLPIPEAKEVMNSVNNLIAVKNPYAISLYGNSPITISQLFNPNPQALQPALVNAMKSWAGYKLPTIEQLDFFKKMNVIPEAKPSEVVKPTEIVSIPIAYHGTSSEHAKNIEKVGFLLSSEHKYPTATVQNYISLTISKDTAENFAKNVSNFVKGSKPEVLKIDTSKLKIFNDPNDEWLGHQNFDDFITELKSKGYDAVKGEDTGEGEIIVFNLKKLIVVKPEPTPELKPEITEFLNIGAKVDKNGIVTVYRGGDISKEQLKNLRYGDYLSTVKTGKDITGNAGASEYGKNVIELKIPIKDLKIENGEIKYIGKSPSLTGGKKYSVEIYKAYNDVYGSNFTAKEIDAMPFDEVRNNASMGLVGGKTEFDNLVKPAIIPTIPKELEPLAEKARKYKSVEEFIKAIDTGEAITKGDLINHKGFPVAGEVINIGKMAKMEGFLIKELGTDKTGFIPRNEAEISYKNMSKEVLTNIYNLAVSQTVAKVETKPTMIKFENKKAATSFYNIALEANRKPSLYAPTKEQPFYKVLIYEEIKPEAPTAPVKPEYAGTEIGGITQPPEKGFILPQEVRDEAEKRIQEAQILAEEYDKNKSESVVSKIGDLFRKSYDETAKLLFTNTPELSKIGGFPELQEIYRRANFIVTDLANRNLTMQYQTLPNGQRNLVTIEENAIKMAQDLEKKYSKGDIADATMGGRFSELDKETLKEVGDKVGLVKLDKNYKKLPESLKNETDKISEYLQLFTNSMYGIPFKKGYMTFGFMNALTQNLDANPKQKPSFNDLLSVSKALTEKGIGNNIIHTEIMALKWRMMNEMKKLTALKYGTDEYSHLPPITYIENGKTIEKYLPENDTSREILKEFTAMRAMLSEEDTKIAKVVDTFNRVISGMATAYNPAFIPTNLTLDQLNVLPLFFKYSKGAIKTLTSLQSWANIFNRTFKGGNIFDRSTNALIFVNDQNKAKKVIKVIGSLVNFTEKFTRSEIAEVVRQQGGDYLTQMYAYLTATGAPQKVGIYKAIRVPFMAFAMQATKSSLNNWWNDPYSSFNDLVEGKGLNKGKRITGGLLALGFLTALAVAGLEKFRKEGKLDRLKMSNKKGELNFPVGDKILTIRVENLPLKVIILCLETLYKVRPEFHDVINELVEATPFPSLKYGFISAVLPPIFTIPYQVLSNYNFAFQSPIVSNPQYAPEPKNNLEKYIWEKFQYRPEYVRFILNSFTADWSKMSDWAKATLTNEETKEVFPVFRRILEPPIEDITNSALSDFYNMYDKIKSGTVNFEKVEGKVEKYGLPTYADTVKSKIGTLLYYAGKAKTKEEARQYRKQATQIAFAFFKLAEPYGLKPSVNYNINLDEYFKTQGGK